MGVQEAADGLRDKRRALMVERERVNAECRALRDALVCVQSVLVEKERAVKELEFKLGERK